jgi:hypothetical protein
MRQVFSRLVVASGLLLLACATAVEDGPLGGDIGEGQGGSTSQAGTASIAGSTSSAGTLPSAGTTSSSAGTTSSSGGKGGSGSTAFGGTATTGGKGGSGSGGANAGASSGGKAGSASGGSATAGTGNGGTGTAGTGTAGTGTGTAGSTSTTCNGVANWSSKTYAMGDTVASVCSGAFAGSCPSGQSHKFECNPGAGAAALPWCQSREPGVGNGWNEAWVDKGQCQ